jgi:photosystem II stability/assembly factor-like uncharacterized protein/glyoxylase-like metal-dependent hydrolase (beta-lactamase superfamily II)
MTFRAALLFAAIAHAQSWVPQTSNSTASLRGISAVDQKEVWASGSGGTFLHTTDGGATWIAAKVPGAESLDFRGIRAIDARTVYLMSSGSGDKARIYKTTDGGQHWDLQFTEPDPKGFFDSIAFWDATHGIVLGDALNGHAEVLTTEDGGRHWQHRQTPPALDKEGSFAASNTCLFVLGKSEVWFVTGGAGAARVFHSTDGGGSWTVATPPIRNDSASAGIFSIAFRDRLHGIVTGGDYNKDKEDRQVAAITSDGGKTWKAPASGPKGFRSAVAYLRDSKAWIATGTSGSDVSTDDGQNWKTFDIGAYNAMSLVSGGAGWAVGPRGHVARYQIAQSAANFVREEWIRSFPPFRIVGNVYYVGTYDLACYLIVTPAGDILINTGLAESASQIKANIESLGFKMSDVKILTVTHAHFDHVAAMAELKRLTGAQVWVYTSEAPLLESGGKADFRFGNDPAAYFTPVTVDRKIADGGKIALGGTELTLHPSPGHTRGAVSFTFPVADGGRTYQVLIANMPSINPGVVLTGKPSYPGIADDYALTFRTLKAITPEIWLASHASQINLHAKYKPGDEYKPERFVDPAGFRTALEALEKSYNDQLAREKPHRGERN